MGYISDQFNGENLLGASVFVAGTSQGTNTNAFGFYSFRLPKGDHRISYSYVGYQQQSVEVRLEKDVKQNIALKTVSLNLPGVTISTPLRDVLNQKHLGELEIDPAKMENMPEFCRG